MIQRVVSGGQSGCDIAALRAAKACGLQTGGWAPKGFLTEDGPMPELLRGYGLREMPTAEYPPRTRKNVAECSACLILVSHDRQTQGAGTALTIRECHLNGRPRLVCNVTVNDEVGEALAWLRSWKPDVLMVAGPRESKRPGIGALAEAFLVELFAALREDQRP
jgi:hypothetical protein